MTSKTITFTQDASIVNEGRVPRLYRAGETHTLRIDQANRWIKRGMAVVADSVAAARAEMEALRVKREAPIVAAPEATEAVTESRAEPEAEVMTPRKPPDAFRHDDIKPSQNQQRRNGNR